MKKKSHMFELGEKVAAELLSRNPLHSEIPRAIIIGSTAGSIANLGRGPLPSTNTVGSAVQALVKLLRRMPPPSSPEPTLTNKAM